MCVYRYFVDVNSLKYKSWLQGLQKEDLQEFGDVICRPQKSLNLLYNIYLKSTKG